jgi:imidazole glycerol-phosphate synthase subunit HisH
MQSRITIVDYGMGNLRSVQKKFIRVGANVQVSRDPNIISMADKLILPGVGHFANGIKNLKEYGLWEILNSKVLVEKTPILGICLGMQLMAKNSEEGDAEGLGWFDADVVKFRMKNSLKYKVPHMGWNNALLNKESLLFKDVPDDIAFYFVHSYHIKCHVVQDILATTEYEYQFTSAIQKDHIFGTQFHPEKSHDWGEKLFANFVKL